MPDDRRSPPSRSTGTGTPPADHTASGPATSSDADVQAFLDRLRATPNPRTDGARGRLIFAMDATMSRQPTWDMALALQGEMFAAVKAVGGLDVKLLYFRGLDECRASKWVSEPDALAALMTKVECRGGYTQIRKVLAHAIDQSKDGAVHALVYVGDCVEEDIDMLCARAGELALLGTPVFLFQEGYDVRAGVAFAEMARLTRGAHCRFDAGSADQLRALLKAVAVYAAGGRVALQDLSRREGGAATLLIEQMR